MNIELADSDTFYTGIVPKQNQQSSKLRNYVENLTKKVDYAKWKQGLVLQYNYVPLRDIIDKLQNEKFQFERRVKVEQQRCRKIIQNKDLLQQLQNFRKFSSTLDQKMKELENAIEQQKNKRNELKKIVQVKSSQLTQQKKTIMLLQARKLQNNGIKTIRDLMIVSKVRRQEKKAETQGNYRSVPALHFKSLVNTEAQTMDKMRTERRSIPSIEVNLKQKKPSELRSLFLDSLNQVLQENNQRIVAQRLGVRDKNKRQAINLQRKINARRKTKSELGQIEVQEIEDSFKIDKGCQYDWEEFRHLSWKKVLKLMLSQHRGIQTFRNMI